MSELKKQKPTDSTAINPTAILGTSGLKRSGGFIEEEWHRQLKHKSGVRFYREMSDNCAVIGGFLLAIEMFVRSVEWRSEPANESERAVAAAEFLDECRKDMSITWEDLIAEILTFLPFGWSYFEEIYKQRNGDDPGDDEDGELLARSRFDDGRIGWRKIAIRGQETLWEWVIDPDGAIKGMIQRDNWAQRGPVFLPIEKCLLFRTKSNKGNPEGRSILRNSFISYRKLRHFQFIEATGIERDLVGLPIMEVPIRLLKEDASADDKALLAALEKQIQQIKRDEREGVIIPAEIEVDGEPTGYKLRAFTTGGKRQFDTNEIITRYENRILSSVLFDWILMGQQTVGSFALADVKTDASSTATKGYLSQIRSVFNRIAIPRLFKLNPEFKEEDWPTIEHGDIELPDLQALADYVFKLIGAGALTPDAPLERDLRQKGGLPEREEPKEGQQPQPQQPPADLPEPPTTQAMNGNGQDVDAV